MPVMQCRVCGRAVADGDRFCTACGTPLDGNVETVAASDDADPDEIPTQQTSAGEPTTDSPPDESPTHPISADDTAPNETPTQQVAADDTPPDAAPTEQASAVGSSPDEGLTHEVAADDTPPNPAPTEQVVDDTPPNPAPTEQATADDTPPNPAPTEQVVDDTPPNAAPAEQAAADDTPLDSAPPRPVPAVDQPTELIAEPPTEKAWGDIDPVWAATVPVAAVTPSTDQLPATEPITEVWPEADRVPPVDPAAAQPTAVVTTPLASLTDEIPVTPISVRERRGFRFTAVTGLSILGSIVTMIAMFATIVTVSSDDRIVGNDNTPANFRVGSWIPSDLADNLPIAGLIAVSLLMCGGVAAGFGWRGGSGLAAGAGLAIAGLAALTIGLAQFPIDAAYEMASIPTDERFTLTITRDLGYWLQLAAAAIGIVVFFASLNDAFGDHRAGLNPWIAALGALSGMVMAAGPLIPEGLAVFSDNWYVIEGPGQAPAMLLSTRLVQLGLLALTSLIGFLSVRRWGLGVAVGGAMPSLWLTVSTMFDLTDHPVGPGFRNPGANEMSVHGVTIIGASALAAFLLLALVAAYDQAHHEW